MVGLLARLKRHPFPVEAFFERVVALSYALPGDQLRPLVPEPLVVDTYEGLGFVTVALVWTRGLRFAGFPRWFGQDFFLAGYRVFVRMRDADGHRLRGLRILRSETDKSRMVVAGNLLTHYRYRRITLEESVTNGEHRVVTRRPAGGITLDLRFDPDSEPAAPPAGSPFQDHAIARRFAGPMPFTFDAEADGRIVVIEGQRQQWTPRPIRVMGATVGLFDEPSWRDCKPVLANAFAVDRVPYRWARGRVVTPRPFEEPADA